MANRISLDPFIVTGICASANFQTQAADIASTTLFTPVIGGIYRISFYASALTGSGSDTPAVVKYSFTDKAGAQVIGTGGTNLVVGLTSVSIPITAGHSLSYVSSPLQLVAGQPVSFSVTGGTYVSLTYSFYIVIERVI